MKKKIGELTLDEMKNLCARKCHYGMGCDSCPLLLYKDYHQKTLPQLCLYDIERAKQQEVEVDE